MKFYEKLGPYQKKEELEKKKDINPNVARNWVITWYSIVAASIILYFVISNRNKDIIVTLKDIIII